MVNFVRAAGRLHVPESQLAHPEDARIFIVGPAELPDTIDPAIHFSRITILLAPRIPVADWDETRNRLPLLVDTRNTAGRCQILFASSHGGLRAEGDFQVGVGSVSQAETIINVGTPGQLDEWELRIPDRTSISAGLTGMKLALPSAQGLLCLSGGRGIGIVDAEGRREIEIDWDGPDRGAFRFKALVDNEGLVALGAGPRFFARSNEDADEGKVPLSTLAYPIFALPEGEQALFTFQIDCAAPHDLHDHAVAAAAPPGEAALLLPRSRMMPPDHPLRSNLHQVHAGEVLLRPAPAAGHPTGYFALTASPYGIDATAETPSIIRGEHYFTPAGAFEVGASDRESVRLTMGLSHLESVSVASADRFVFERAMPAFAPADSTLDEFEGICTTSWLRLVPGVAAVETEPFALQPEGMQAYHAAAAGGQPMAFKEIRYPNAGEAFPFVPLLGVDRDSPMEQYASAGERLQFERRVLALSRRRILTRETPAMALAAGAMQAPANARTPQGYEVSRESQVRAWSRIVFTMTALRSDDNGVFPELGEVGLRAPPGTEAAVHLALALAQNQLMLVTTWRTLKRMKFDMDAFERIHIGGWGVSLTVDTPPAAMHGAVAAEAGPESGLDPLVVIKYADRSIKDLAGDTSQWVAYDKFSGPAVAERLRRIIEQRTDDTFSRLASRLDSPQWNGLLILDAVLPVVGIPAGMRAIAAGLPAFINVPYAGLDITSIDPNQPPLQPWKSALFGLVLHEKPDMEFSTDGATEIGMRVPDLKVRVENDGIEMFECQLELKLPGVFDVKATNAEDTLTLIGHCESSVENNRLHERYTFLAEGNFTKRFDSPSVVKEVTFNRLRLVTDRVEGDMTIGSFVIDGAMEFNEVMDADLFGISKLVFKDLAIKLAFRFKDSKLLDLALRFHYPDLRFDLDLFNSGVGRRAKDGFIKAFPLKLRGFRVGDLHLPELGYFDLGGLLPTGGFGLSSKFRFGLDFDIDLGSLGALAKKLDRFKLQLILGWEPRLNGTTLTGIAAGFRIDFGGGSGGIDLGLQGIMRLWAKRFSLNRVDKVFVLSADDCHIEVLGKEWPEQGQTFSLFLFANLNGGEPFERLGWYASFKDDTPSAPLKISHLVLGQRVNVQFDEVRSTSDALRWLEQASRFDGADGARNFVDFAKKKVTYDRSREWFLALKGDFFKVFRLGLVLKDPDMYGVYLGLLADDAHPHDTPMSFDLLYQKLADGVGKYSVEVGLPPGFRTFECGVFSVTLGMIRCEVYTDGGLLVDLGYPVDVDYTRSFAVQAMVFIGKGGMYIGRTSAIAVNFLPDGYKDVFRAGFAMKVGLGRELEQGPLRAGLSICVFARTEGYFAIADRSQHKPGSSEILADAPYWLHLEGQVGLIAEIEGMVDLRLIRARVLVRVWIASGIVLETNKPIVLHCEAGVSVAVEFEIASFRVFGRRIRITIMLRFSTTLRYEFALPAKLPKFVPLLGAKAMALPALPVPQRTLGPWSDPATLSLGVLPQPMDLRLGYDFTVEGRELGQAHTVLVPTVMWVVGDGLNSGRNPFEAIVRGLAGWAALRSAPGVTDASAIVLQKTPGDDLDLELLEKAIKEIDSVSFDLLDQFFSVIAQGSRLRHIPSVEGTATGFLFPLPPRLALELTWDHGQRQHDFATLGTMAESEIQQLMDDCQRQFAEILLRSPAQTMMAATPRPLVDHLFRSWCGALALAACDAARTAWKTAGTDDEKRTLGDFFDALAPADWNTVASRAGRMLLSGVRVGQGANNRALAGMVGLFMHFDDAAVNTALSPVKESGPTWLQVQAEKMTVDWPTLSAVATRTFNVPCRDVPVAAVRRIARKFYHPAPLKVLDGQGTRVGILSRASGDFLVCAAATPLENMVFSVAKTSQQAGQVDPDAKLLKTVQPALIFEMTLERLPAEGQETGFLPCAFRLSGASEADRLGLDALIEDMLAPDKHERVNLEASRLMVGVLEGDEPNTRFKLLSLAATDAAQCVVARSTATEERRPVLSDKVMAALAEFAPLDPEKTFLATFEASSRFKLLYLLRRAAIVNAEGTTLLLPAAAAQEVSALFNVGASRRSVKLLFALVFAPANPLPIGVRNAVLFEDAADLAAIEEPDRRIVAELASARLAVEETAKSAGMVESISTRPAGTELVRVWRKRTMGQAAGNALIATDAALADHLAQRFDMLEFQLLRDGSDVPLITYGESLPVSSEEAIPPDGTYPEHLRAWLRESRPAGYDDHDLRYDLIVPLSKLMAPDGGPYAAIGHTFTLALGWRDLYGNRWGDAGPTSIKLQPRYTDAVVPLAAWPCVKARVHAGAEGSRMLVLVLDVDISVVPAEAEEKKIVGRELRRIIDQVTDGNAAMAVRCGLGDVSGEIHKKELVIFLEAIAQPLCEGEMPAPGNCKYEIQVAPRSNEGTLPLTLTFSIVRPAHLVANVGEGSTVTIDATSAWTAVRMDSIAGAGLSNPDFQRQFATEFNAAFTLADHGPVERLWAALGTTMDATPDWWAVNDRMFPLASGMPATAYGAPPMARALMGTTLAADVAQAPDYKVKEKKSGTFLDKDVDALLSAFLDRVETFLSPAFAHCTALAPATGETPDKPFERVARDKAFLLGAEQEGVPLLQTLRPVFAEMGKRPDKERVAAVAELREACAPDLRRFYEIGSVLVKQLAQRHDPEWIKTATGKLRPKLYGQLKFGQLAGQSAGFRAMTRGVSLDQTLTYLSMPVISDLSDQADTADLGEISYQFTHVERVVDGNTEALASSRWLSLVPINNAGDSSLPAIKITAGESAPLPRRRVPEKPVLRAHTFEAYAQNDAVNTYEGRVQASRRWTYGFDVEAEFQPRDEVCVRLLYNLPAGSSPLIDKAPESAAQPLVEGLFEALVRHEMEVAPYWQRILAEGRVPSGGTDLPVWLVNACNQFAESVRRVAETFGPRPMKLNDGQAPEQDKFILVNREALPGKPPACTTTIQFADHFSGDAVTGVLAGEGRPWLRIRRVLGTVRDGVTAGQLPQPAENTQLFAEFNFQGDQEVRAVRRVREVQVGRMDALRQQSVWVAAAVRRNRTIDKHLLDETFVYRTPEAFFNQAMSPQLIESGLILFAPAQACRLEDLIRQGLEPVLKDIRSQDGVYVQLTVDYESGKISDLIEACAAPASALAIALPQPDPKLLLPATKVTDATQDAARLASHLAQGLHTRFTTEPVGRAADGSRGRLLMNVVISAATKTGPGQTILRLERLGLDLRKVTDL